MIPAEEDEYEVAKRKLQDFKKKIGLNVYEDSAKGDNGDKKDLFNNDCTMFTPVRESLMGLVGISSINCNPKHTTGSCQPAA